MPSFQTVSVSGNGVVHSVAADMEDTGDVCVRAEQEAGGIVAAARAARDAPHDPDMRPVAAIPMSVIEQAMREGWFRDPAAWKRWANDPANRDFRIHEGRV